MSRDRVLQGSTSKGKIYDAEAMSSTNTYYSAPFYIESGTVWSVMLQATTISSWTATITLWATNKPDASETDDTDWVQMTSTHGWDNFVSGNPSAASSYKDLADVGVSGALKYRLKIVNASGSATIEGWVSRKDDIV